MQVMARKRCVTKQMKSNSLSKMLMLEKRRNAKLEQELLKFQQEMKSMKDCLYTKLIENPNVVGTKTGIEEYRYHSSVNQLSIAAISVPECKPVSENEEIHRQAFESWKDLLIDSMNLVGVNDEATRFIVFKVKAGARLLEIFRNTTSTDGRQTGNEQQLSGIRYQDHIIKHQQKPVNFQFLPFTQSCFFLYLYTNLEKPREHGLSVPTNNSF